MSITEKSLMELSEGLQSGAFSSREITKAYLQRIEELNPIINAYITLTKEQALAAADLSDARRARGQALSPLDGVPIGLKDNFCTEGVLTTCSSKMLYNYKPPYSATCWQKLQDAGCVLLGKTNMDEFAMGSSTETSAYGLTRNPFDIERVPGGSSGGSAAAVAADLAAFALGSDTGGSTRQPAHFCGVVGVKPTYGRISRFGIVPFASSLDQAGVLAKNVRDAATVLAAISGPDEADATSAPLAPGDYRAACDKPARGMKIGLPTEFMARGIEAETLAALQQAAELLRSQGATVEEISLPHSKYALPAYYVLSSAEASTNMARYDGVQYGLRVERDNIHDMYTATRSAGLGEEVQRRILLGTYTLSAGYADAYYNKTLKIRTLVKGDYDKAFAEGYDCLLTPVAAGPAFKLGERIDDPMAMYMTDICTVPVNLAGLPGLVLPFALQNGLPLGLQLIGRPFGEEALFTLAAALEQPRFVPPDIAVQAREKGVVYHD